MKHIQFMDKVKGGDLERLEQWSRCHGTPQQVALRCRLILAAASGRSDADIAGGLKGNRHTVALWRKRVCDDGVGALWEIAPGRGRKPGYSAAKLDVLIKATLNKLPKGQTQWNEAPRPFVWTATAGDIVAKIDRARKKLESIKPGSTLLVRRKKRKG